MLKINSKYEAEKDTYGWQLIETYKGKGKDKKPKDMTRSTYYARFSQVCQAIIDREAGKCEDINELLKLLNSASVSLAKKVKCTEKREEKA